MQQRASVLDRNISSIPYFVKILIKNNNNHKKYCLVNLAIRINKGLENMKLIYSHNLKKN